MKELSIKRYILFFFVLCAFTTISWGQAGSSAFAFLGMPMSARLNGLGGNNVSLKEGELSMALNNPALLSQETDKVVEVSYAYYLQNMHLASALYSQNYKDNYFGGGIHYLDYGRFRQTDAYGNRTGAMVTAKDILIDLMYARQLGPLFSVGVNLKPVYSIYHSYFSFALGADVGGHFQTKDSTLHVGISLQNIGWQLKGFYSEESGQHREMLPINLQLGLNYRFKHAPFRFSFTIHNLQRWNLNYESTNQQETNALTGELTNISDVKWYDMLFRHTIFALDIVPKSDRFYFTISYNHRHRMEMNLRDQHSIAGFAFGAGVRIKQFRIAAAYSQQLKGENVIQVSLSANINDFLK